MCAAEATILCCSWPVGPNPDVSFLVLYWSLGVLFTGTVLFRGRQCKSEDCPGGVGRYLTNLGSKPPEGGTPLDGPLESCLDSILALVREDSNALPMYCALQQCPVLDSIVALLREDSPLNVLPLYCTLQQCPALHKMLALTALFCPAHCAVVRPAVLFGVCWGNAGGAPD